MIFSVLPSYEKTADNTKNTHAFCGNAICKKEVYILYTWMIFDIETAGWQFTIL